MKKIILAVVLVICSLGANAIWRNVPAERLGETSVDNVRYELIKSDVWGYGTFACATGFSVDESQIPMTVKIANVVTIDGTSYPVKRIWRKAFMGCKNPHEFVLPESLESVETLAFADCKEVGLKVNSNVKLHDSIFCNTALADVRVLEYVSELWNWSLVNCITDKLYFGQNLRVFGSQLMKGCNARYVEFGDCPERGVARIYRQAFINSEVEEVRIGKNIELCFQAFCFCSNLKRVILPDTEKYYMFGRQYTVYGELTDDERKLQEPYPYGDKEFDYLIADCPNIREIVVQSAVPPTFYNWIDPDPGPTSALKSYSPKEAAGGFAKLLRDIDYNIIDDHSKCVLKVPAGSEELYRAHPIWGKFEHIEGFQPGEYTGIDGVSVDRSSANSVVKAMAGNAGLSVAIGDACTVEVYDIMGRLVMRADHQGGVFKADVPSGVYVLRTVK